MLSRIRLNIENIGFAIAEMHTWVKFHLYHSIVQASPENHFAENNILEIFPLSSFACKCCVIRPVKYHTICNMHIHKKNKVRKLCPIHAERWTCVVDFSRFDVFFPFHSAGSKSHKAYFQNVFIAFWQKFELVSTDAHYKRQNIHQRHIRDVMSKHHLHINIRSLHHQVTAIRF